MEPAYNYEGLRLFTSEKRDGTPLRVEHRIPGVNQFAAEMDAFSNAVMNNEPVRTPGRMGLADIRIILAVLESARQGGRPVSIGSLAPV